MEVAKVFHNPHQVNKVSLRCRNFHCAAELEKPTDNLRLAFCSAGCEQRFYRIHCRVCECLLPPKTRRRQVCGRAKCRYAFKRDSAQFYGLGSRPTGVAHNARKTAAIPMPKTAVSSGRPWCVVAGPELSKSSLRAAALPPYPDPPRNPAPPAPPHIVVSLIGPAMPPTNIINGYRWPNAVRARALFGERA
jgi:hypothetical protein